MKNVITKEEYKDVWEILFEDYEIIEREYRRGSNFYCQLLIQIDPETYLELKDKPELYGNWLSETVIWDSEYGLDIKPEMLYRAEKKTKTVVTEEWVKVK